ALTGGRATAEEQRRLGGEPWKCIVFELYTYHLAGDENELREVYNDCVSGRVLCGQCKRRAAEKLRALLVEHQKRYYDFRNNVEKYVEKPSF
ncbi:MAG: tryptophan--tRNA ligase, partial [Desulfurococcaceae archaeon]|nr:tryptophan--tRNA ligase [Desulfurococcaceae archaeon]